MQDIGAGAAKGLLELGALVAEGGMGAMEEGMGSSNRKRNITDDFSQDMEQMVVLVVCHSRKSVEKKKTVSA